MSPDVCPVCAGPIELDEDGRLVCLAEPVETPAARRDVRAADARDRGRPLGSSAARTKPAAAPAPQGPPPAPQTPATAGSGAPGNGAKVAGGGRPAGEPAPEYRGITGPTVDRCLSCNGELIRDGDGRLRHRGGSPICGLVHQKLDPTALHRAADDPPPPPDPRHPVDPTRRRRPDDPDEYERGKRDGEADRPKTMLLLTLLAAGMWLAREPKSRPAGRRHLDPKHADGDWQYDRDEQNQPNRRLTADIPDDELDGRGWPVRGGGHR